jgi:hypothetical protein
MRNLLVIALVIAVAACAAKPAVVSWVTSGTDLNERIEIQSSGHVSYTTTLNGTKQKDDLVILSSEQVDELDEVFRNQHACDLAHDPSYTPGENEGQTTLVLAFPDQHCTVVLWNAEWERGRAQPITETMRSMRPLHVAPGRVNTP